MDDSLQRRAIWLAALTTFAFLFQSLSLGVFLGSLPVWRAALFVASIAALVAAVGLAGLTYARDGLPRSRRLPRDEWSLALSYGLMWLAFLLNAIQVSSAVVQSAGEPGFE
jgi:hypothetical protein